MNYTKKKTIIANKTNKTKTKKKNYTNKYFYTLKGGSNKHINHKTITREKDKFWTNVNLDYINNNKTQGNDNIFFNAEKLSIDTLIFWKKYCANQKQQFNSINRSTMHPYSEGLLGFEESLELFNQRNNYHIWIIFVANTTLKDKFKIQTLKSGKILEDINISCFNEIEMCLTLFIGDNVPITTHMGIFRNAHYFTKSKSLKTHKNLSLYLHSFAAKISKIIVPNTYYMVTSPTKIMRTILVKEIEKYVEKLKKHNTETHNTETHNSKIKLEDIIVIGNNKERNRVRKAIKSKSTNETPDIQKLVQELKDLKEKKQNSNFRTIEDIESNIKTIVNTEFKEEENIANSKPFDFKISKAILNKKQNRIDTIKYLPDYNAIYSLNDYEKNYRNQEFIPHNSDYNPPLHFINDTQWSITYNDTLIEFDKPLWFIHKYLLNNSKTTIIDINHLANMYFRDYTL
jgi:hypothetical protein